MQPTDIRTLTDEQIAEHIRAQITEPVYAPDLTIVRADRHDRLSPVTAIEIELCRVTFLELTALAGALMTPAIKICAGAIDGDPIVRLIATWDAPLVKHDEPDATPTA